MANKTIALINLSIWQRDGKGKKGYCLVMAFKDSVAIVVGEARYKKDLLPRLREYGRWARNINYHNKLAILHQIDKEVRDV